MRRCIDKVQLKELVDLNYQYGEISKIMGFTETSLCRCYTKNYGQKSDRASSYRQAIVLTKEQEEIIFGSLLGDMALQKHTKTYRGSESHSIKQKEYALYKKNLLNPLCGNLRYFTVKAGGKEYQEVGFSIRPNIKLEFLYHAFYGMGKKDVPEDLSLLTPRAIAFWFMDDGFKVSGNGKMLGFSTCSFTLDGLLRLKKHLKETYNIESIIRKNFYLIIKAKDCQKLITLIKPYMIEEMYYKIDI